MQAHWSYNVAPTSATVYPWDKAAIVMSATDWHVACHSSTGSDFSALVKEAAGSVFICLCQSAREILGNVGNKADRLLSSIPPDGNFAFASFWFDQSANPNAECILTIGLSDDRCKALYDEIKFASRNDILIEVRAGSRFSDIENNPHSICPTCEQFELGYPTALDDFTVSLIFPKRSACRSEDVIQ